MKNHSYFIVFSFHVKKVRRLTFKSFLRDRSTVSRVISPLMLVTFDNYLVMFCLAGEDIFLY